MLASSDGIGAPRASPKALLSMSGSVTTSSDVASQPWAALVTSLHYDGSRAFAWSRKPPPCLALFVIFLLALALRIQTPFTGEGEGSAFNANILFGGGRVDTASSDRARPSLSFSPEDDEVGSGTENIIRNPKKELLWRPEVPTRLSTFKPADEGGHRGPSRHQDPEYPQRDTLPKLHSGPDGQSTALKATVLASGQASQGTEEHLHEAKSAKEISPVVSEAPLLAPDSLVIASEMPSTEQQTQEYDVFFSSLAGFGQTATFSDQHLLLAAEMAVPSSRVHVLTDIPHLLRRVTELSSSRPWGGMLMAKNATLIAKGARDSFMPVYRHQSVNPREYEAYCFWRWGMYSLYVKEILNKGFRVTRIWTLDADVVPLRRYSDWLPLDHAAHFGKMEDFAILAAGAVTLWSSERLLSFFSFILEIYRTKEKLEKFVRSFGESKRCRHAEIIPCTGSLQLHVSDMNVVMAFSEEHMRTALHVPVGDFLVKKKVQVEAFRNFSCIGVVQATKFLISEWWLTVASSRDLEDNSKIPKELNLLLPLLPRPACFLHFQGRSKLGMQALLDFVWAKKNASNLDLRWLKCALSRKSC